MQIAAATEPGSPDKPNEDGIAVTNDMTAVLDGATVRTDTGCIHGVPWFVEKLAGSLIGNKHLPITDTLAAAITATALAHADTCNLTHPGTPSAAVAIVRIQDGLLQYLVLGDVTLAIEMASGLRIVTDDRVAATASAERAIADALPSGSPEKAAALVQMKHAELAARNVPGGFWVAAADPAVVRHSLTGEFALREVHRVALLTDGAVRAVSPFKIYDWPNLLSFAAREGLQSLIGQVRAAEDRDPTGVLYPRNKIHDDATIALISP